MRIDINNRKERTMNTDDLVSPETVAPAPDAGDSPRSTVGSAVDREVNAVISELYDLHQKVEGLVRERGVVVHEEGQATGSSFVSPLYKRPPSARAHSVGFASPAFGDSPAAAPSKYARASFSQEGPSSTSKRRAIKRRPKRSKAKRKKSAVPTTPASLSASTTTAPSSLARSAATARSSKVCGPTFARSPRSSLPTRFSSSSPEIVSGGFAPKCGIIGAPDAPRFKAPVSLVDERRRPLILAKKLYGHFVNLQSSYLDLKTTLDRQTSALSDNHFKVKQMHSKTKSLEEENELLKSRLRVASSLNEKRASRVQLRLHHFLETFDRKLLKSSVVDWKIFVARSRARCVKMERFLKHWRYRHIKLIFTSWRRTFRDSAKTKRKLSSFRTRWLQRLTYRGFKTLQDRTERYRVRAQNLNDLVAKIVNVASLSYISHAFFFWRTASENIKYVSLSMSRIHLRSRIRKEKKVLLNLMQFSQRRRFLRRLFGRISGSFVKASLSQHFRRWNQSVAFIIDEEWIAEQDELKSIIRERDDKIERLETFRDVALCKEKDRAVKVLNKIVHSQLYMAWNRWEGEVNSLRRFESVKNRALAKWRLRPCAATILKWTKFVERRKKVRKTILRSLSDLSYQKMAAAIGAWKRFMSLADQSAVQWLLDESGAKVSALEMVLSEKEQQIKHLLNYKERVLRANRDKAVSVLCLVFKKALAASLKLWREHVQEHQRQEALMQRFLKRWKNNIAVSCIQIWREYVHTRAKLRRIIMRASTDKKFNQKDAAMRSWKQFVQGFDSCKLQAKLNQLSKALKEQADELRSKDSELGSLRAQVDHLYGDKKRVAVKAITKIVNAQLSCAFKAWSDNVREAMHYENIVKKFVSRMKNAGAMRCLKSWQDHARTRVKMRNFVRKNLFNKSAKVVTLAWRTWIQNVKKIGADSVDAENRRLRQLLEEREQKILALEQENASSEAMLVKVQEEKFEMNMKSMNKFVKMWQNRCLVGSLLAWRGFAVKQRNQKGVMKKFVTKMVHSKVQNALSTWHEFLVFERRNEALLQRFAIKFMFRTASKTFETWKAYVAIRLRERGENDAWERKASAVLGKMMNSKLYRVFNNWRENAAELKRNREIVLKFVKRMKLSGVRKSVTSWKELVKTRKWLRRICSRMIGGHERKMLSIGLESWKVSCAQFFVSLLLFFCVCVVAGASSCYCYFVAHHSRSLLNRSPAALARSLA